MASDNVHSQVQSASHLPVWPVPSNASSLFRLTSPFFRSEANVRAAIQLLSGPFLKIRPRNGHIDVLVFFLDLPLL